MRSKRQGQGLRQLLGVGKPTPPRKHRKAGKSGSSSKSAPLRGGLRR